MLFVLTFLTLAFLPLALLAEEAAAGVAAGGDPWANLQYLVPLVAPMLIFLIKKIPGWFETKFSKQLLPYACVAVAFVLMLLLDLFGRLTIPLWVAGPIAGAIGIGSRELLDKGLVLIGLSGDAKTPATARIELTPGGVVSKITVTNGGSGYAIVPTVTISGDGTGATAETVVYAGKVVAVVVTNGGSGYTIGMLTVTIAPPV